MVKKGKKSTKSTYSAGQIMRNARDAHRLSVWDVAGVVKLSPTQYTRIELGTETKSKKTGKITYYKLSEIKDLLRICNLFEIPYERLLYEMAKDLHIPYLFPISSTSLTGNFENTENNFGKLINKLYCCGNQLSDKDFKALLNIVDSYIDWLKQYQKKVEKTKEEALIEFVKLNTNSKAVYSNDSSYIELPQNFDVTKCVVPEGWKLIQQDVMGLHIATLEKAE